MINSLKHSSPECIVLIPTMKVHINTGAKLLAESIQQDQATIKKQLSVLHSVKTFVTFSAIR